MFLNHLILAYRNLVRHKTTSFINVLGLSIGITSALVIGIYVRYELSFDRYHEKAERTYKVVQETKMPDGLGHDATTAYPLAAALRNDFQDQVSMVAQCSGPVNSIFMIQDTKGNISRYDEPYVLFVDADYPRLFDFKWIQGDSKTALLQTNSIVLTVSAAKRFFGNDISESSILGREVLLNNKDALRVTGLIENSPAENSMKYTVLAPYEFFRINNPFESGNWSGNYQGTSFLLLKPGDSPATIESQLTSWKKKYLKPEDNSRIFYHLLPLTKCHSDTQYGHAPQSYTMPTKILYSAIGIGLFMLVIACVNFINLATAQSATRAREVGVRKVMGSSRFGLIKQFVNENLILVLIALVLSLALSQMAISAMNDILSIIGLHLVMDLFGVGFAVFIAAIVVVLACVYPAIVVASYKPVDALKNKIFDSNGKLPLRRVLIVVQFSIVQLFIIGTLVVSSQMRFMKNKDLGFSMESPIVVINTFGNDRVEVLRQKLLADPGVTNVTVASSTPMSDYNHHYGTNFWRKGESVEEGKSAEEKGVDSNYLNFYNLELIAGRNFSRVEEHVFREFIVNEKLIKELGWTPEQAIGQPLVINEGEATIVGVIRDFHNNSLQEELSPCVFLNSKDWLDVPNIKIDPSVSLSEAMTAIESTWKEVYPEGVFEASFLDDDYMRHYALEQLILKGFTIFATLTIIIGCLGLYGLLSFVTLRKTKEVGIRKVLGASVFQIVTLFTTEFILLVIVAFLIALPFGYYWMNSWLNDFAYRVALTWPIFAMGVSITLIITLLTIGYQSLRAANSNPINALRGD